MFFLCAKIKKYEPTGSADPVGLFLTCCVSAAVAQQVWRETPSRGECRRSGTVPSAIVSPGVEPGPSVS